MKEPASLPDIQLARDTRKLALQRVGVSAVEMPLKFQTKSGDILALPVTARMTVQLCENFRGVHMSRFVTLLSEWGREHLLPVDIRSLLNETATRLHSTGAHIELAFRYFIDKQSPVTQSKAPMAFSCVLSANYQSTDGLITTNHALNVEVPVSTLCPCSKAMAKYGAHNQRTIIRAEVKIDEASLKTLFIEDLVEALEGCASCPVYPVLKRPDEKHVTERQYDNPKFVEDVLRDAILMLRTFPGVNGFALEIESLESIHGHNAWAAHEENFSRTHG